MATKLSIDGVVFSGGKEISSWTPTPLAGGIKVEWSPEDIQIIEGTIWDITDAANHGITWEDVFPLTSGKKLCSGGYLVWTSTQLQIGHTNWRVRYRLTGGDIFSSLQNEPKYQVQFGKPHGGLCPTQSANTYINTVWRVTESGIRSTIVQTTGATVEAQMWIQARYISPWTKVTSNTGAVSFRETSIAPEVSLLAGSCGLVVNYADGSQSPVLEFPQCPQDVFLVEDEVCQNACNLANSIINKLG